MLNPYQQSQYENNYISLGRHKQKGMKLIVLIDDIIVGML